MPETLKLAIVTDIHHGPDKLTKVGSAALPGLRAFKTFTEDYRPHFIAELGDRISDIDAETDAGLLREVGEHFADLPAPHRHLMGNHDQVYLSAADNARILGQDMGHYSVDIAGRHLVFWQLDCEIHHPQGFIPVQSDLDWLAADLAGTNLPAIIFTHVPLDGGSMHGNFYFDNNARFGGLPHHREIQDLIRRAGNVILCVAGHVHWNDVNFIDGIPHITVQSLSESFTTEGEAAVAWASIEVDDEVRWRAHGRDGLSLAVPVRGLNAHWKQSLPAFEELMRLRQIPDHLDGIKGLILDMDGVLYKGDDVVPGAAEAISALRAGGMDLIALTNNARATSKAYSDKLAAMGIEFPPEDIITAGQAAARYLVGLEPAPKVFIAGSETLRHELLSAGAVESEEPDFVVAGIDLDMKLETLSKAVGHLHRGAKLIASNPDTLLPVADGIEPEAGAVVAFLEAASGQTAYVAGKPNRAIFDQALAKLSLDGASVAVVGDTLETDIAGATAAGLRSILVASGNASEAVGNHRPTARLADLTEVAARLTLEG